MTVFNVTKVQCLEKLQESLSLSLSLSLSCSPSLITAHLCPITMLQLHVVD